MICEPCARGADLAEVAADPREHGGIRRAAATFAARSHGKCRGGTWCDCQHRPPANRS